MTDELLKFSIMSSSVSVADITAMSLRFAVKWSISVRELAYISTSGENIVLRSNRYRFKNIKNLEFAYNLFYDEDYKMRVDCETDMPMFLEDALILIEDLVYRVQCNPTNTLGRLVFSPNELTENSFEDYKVTFHCIMSIPAHVEAVIPNPAEAEMAVNIVECESIVTYPNIHPHGYDAVSEFEYSSRIPNFNVAMALNMIGEAHTRQNSILKALCSEYLMENLTSENVAEVLKQSVDSDAKHLLQKCVEFLSQCKIIY